MKVVKLFWILGMFIVLITSCQKDELVINDDLLENELKSLETELKAEEGDSTCTFEKVIVVPLVKPDDCNYITEGVIEFYKDGTLYASIDFGDGVCDDVAMKTKDGETFEITLGKKRTKATDKKKEKGEKLTKNVVKPLEWIDDCEYPVAGTIEFLKGEEVIAVLDYGDGTCDNLATKTVGDEVYEITLKPKSDYKKKDQNKKKKRG